MKVFRIFVLVFAVILLLLTSGCPNITDSLSGSGFRTIGDAAHDGPNGRFYFLPPMVGWPDYSGDFDGDLSPTVSIPSLGVTYSMDSNEGSKRIRVSVDDEHYIVNWHTRDYDLVVGDIHRIIVSVNGAELGFVDVQIVDKGSDIQSVDEGLYVAVKNGRTLPIKFRIETATPVTSIDVEPEELVLDIGETAPLTALVLPLDADDRSVEWHSGDDEIVTVDSEGLVSAVGPGITEVIGTTISGGITDRCTITVLPPILDAFVVNYGGPNYLWANDGTGVLTLNQTLTGSSPQTMDVYPCDWDGDGDLDVYLGSAGPDEVWRNDNGTFVRVPQVSPIPPPLASLASIAVVLGDISGDGIPDAVSVGGSTFYYMRGRGDGTFYQQQTLPGSSSHEAALGDLDGDGDLDLVVACYGYNRLYANDSGVLNFVGVFDDGTNHFDVELADLDDDGDLDIITGADHISGVVTWRNQHSEGTNLSPADFVYWQRFGGNAICTALGIGDLDGDETADIFVSNRSGSPEVWYNDGSGNFGGQRILPMTNRVWEVALGDVDRDFDLDILIVRNGNLPNQILQNDGAGAFTLLAQLPLVDTSWAGVLAPFL